MIFSKILTYKLQQMLIESNPVYSPRYEHRVNARSKAPTIIRIPNQAGIISAKDHSTKFK